MSRMIGIDLTLKRKNGRLRVERRSIVKGNSFTQLKSVGHSVLGNLVTFRQCQFDLQASAPETNESFTNLRKVAYTFHIIDIGRVELFNNTPLRKNKSFRFRP